MRYPEARRDDTAVERHGQVVPDPYRWLETDSPATGAWTKAQDALAEGYFAGLAGERAAWLRRLAELERPTVGTPKEGGGRVFVTRGRPGAEHPVLVVIEPDGRERVVLDPADLSERATMTLDVYTPSPDGRLLAYQVSDRGDDRSFLHVLDVGRGETLGPPVCTGWAADVAWLPDSHGFVYQRPSAPLVHDVWRHEIGTGFDRDALVFADPGVTAAEYRLSLDPAGSRLAVTVEHSSLLRTDVHVVDLRDGGRTTVQSGPDVLTYARFGPDGRLYLLTAEGAPRWRLAEVGDDGAWRDVIAEGEDILYAFAFHGRRILAAHRRDVVSVLSLHDPSGALAPVELPLPGRGRLDLGGGLVYTDHTTPPTLLRLSADGPVAVEETEAVAGVSVEQLFATSADGTRIPFFLLSPSDVPAGRRLPTIVEGYGGWNVSWPPEYRPTWLAWVLAGGRYAMTNLRGGGEYGAAWFAAGMRAHQQNPVDDFIACARLIVERGSATSAMLGASGGSKGGITVGAAITQEPGLFAAAVMSAPMLDMVRFEEHGEGAQWTNGFGSAADSAQFAWLRDISPVARVRGGVEYPDALFTIFDNDARVHPAHARKMCASLQHGRPETAGPLLLRRRGESGHGARSASRARDLHADHLTFFADRLGLS
ncbi:prolyl oligopeptidase family serine peptidase [Phytomonospora endophytica]|uniref:prolyl oligopeptidase n=1 Tax=Phytomonospora endophytica TaxID=714109 RepID=A0A841G330_9ACTN|nr:prolyl oligopeptidase family serine peptidase [Phytomonospora endophytica]MBB6039119.1 prolyl oligopeptidase [Phytomonospora endophytica]GIG67644.1 prolyl endopeptidase [Phytomonospora endophytica]